jgi:hypothetical protein
LMGPRLHPSDLDRRIARRCLPICRPTFDRLW